MVPVVEELRSIPSPADALRAFAGADGLVLFDSALHRGRLGRYSFLTANPLISFEIQQATFGSDPFTRVRDTISQLNQSFELQRLPDLPPFQGGVAGTLSYELGGCWERAPRVGEDEFQLPDAWFGVYDWVLAWDHDQDRAWIVSHGLPVIGPHVTGQPGVTISAASDSDYEACQARAAHRVRDVLAMLDSADQNSPPPCDAGPTTCDRGPMTGNDRSIAAVDPSRLNPLPGWDGVSSDFTRDEYLTAVARVIEYIHAGDIFQANLSQRLLARCELPPVELYRTLRTCNPAPFAGFLAHDDWAIVSASPERFLRVEDGVVEARPIKGTRQRRVGPEADLFSSR